MELLSQRAYAERRGVTHRAVQKAVASGRITLVNGKVDPEAADRDWDRKTDPNQRARASQQTEQEEGEGSLWAEKTRVEKNRADLLEMDAAERRGELIDRAAVRSEWGAKLKGASDLLLSIPDRVSAQFAAETDALKIHVQLMAEIRQAMRLVAADPVSEQ